ncbi:MAG: hypothetical protein ACTSQO_04695 [Candidatus Helarchaeota archaeon]
MLYLNKWITDFRARLAKYQDQSREPQLNVKSYFVDSGLFLLDLLYLYPNNEHIDTVWNWIYNLGSLFAWNVSSDYFGRFNNANSNEDLKNCNNTIQQMNIAFHAMNYYKVPIEFSIFKRFFERVPKYISILSNKLGNYRLRSLVLYGSCISIQTFGYLLEKFDQKEYYREISQNCYDSSIAIIINYFKKYDIFKDLPNSFGLWSFCFEILQRDPKLKSFNFISQIDFENHMLDILESITRFGSIPYILDNLREKSIKIFDRYLNKLKDLLKNFQYSGTFWSQLARLAKAEFYINVYNIPEIIKKYLIEFPSFDSTFVPQKNIDQFLKTILEITDLIEEDSSLKSLIRSDKYKEKNFRDFFKTHFRIKKWLVDAELEGKLDYLADLRVIIPKTLFRISIEFKIWKRNFNRYPPIQELLDNMGTNDSVGVIFMVNPNKNSIIESYKNELIINHPKYFPGTIEEIEFDDRLYSIFESCYKENNKLITIYHIIFNTKDFEIRNQ